MASVFKNLVILILAIACSDGHRRNRPQAATSSSFAHYKSDQIAQDEQQAEVVEPPLNVDQSPSKPEENLPPVSATPEPTIHDDTPLPPQEDETTIGDESQTLQTSDAASLKKLIFSASSKREEERHLTEYLLVLTAKDKTCMRLKVRATTQGEATQDSKPEDFICKKDLNAGDAANPPEEGDDKSDSDGKKKKKDVVSQSKEGTEEAISQSKDVVLKSKDTTEDFVTKSDNAFTGFKDAVSTKPSSPSFSAPKTPKVSGGLFLADTSEKTSAKSICSQRLFRMPNRPAGQTGDSKGLDQVNQKTGYLVYQSPSVNVWFDAEIANPCISGALHDLDAIPLILGHALPQTWELGGYGGVSDRIRKQHFENVAKEASNNLKLLTKLYGNVSDTDANGKVDIFISPEVNRYYFDNSYSKRHDLFSVGRIFKPEDLQPYNANTNPTSNEGEVLYLWATDPAGLYRYSQYPTANSISSHYSFGFLSSQIMNLIMLNGKDIKEPWLINSLSFLASSYTNGNDYTVDKVSEYLTFRHQHVSLTQEMLPEDVPKNFQSGLLKAQHGIQTLFGWYLHARLCGKTLQPCAKLSELISSTNSGKAALEKMFGEPFETTLSNFGASLGAAMSDNPDSVKSAWKRTTHGDQDKTLVTFPPLGELAKITETIYQDQTSENFEEAKDAAISGALPTKDALLYQVVLPDNDLDLTLAPDSVSYVLLTGLLQPKTEMSAYFGKNLSVTIVPLGERNSEMRRIHTEKISELAHLDLRPVNLTKLEGDPQKTYYTPPNHSVDFTVTPKREIWIMGSIDNFSVNKAGAAPSSPSAESSSSAEKSTEEASISDTDSYNLMIDPCKGETDLTACREGKPKRVMLQIMPRSFEKELLPAIMVTSPDLSLFRGRVFSPKVKTFLADFKEPRKEVISVTCESQSIYSTAAQPSYEDYLKCSNAGLLEETYLRVACPSGTCAPGIPKQAVGYDALTYRELKYEGPLYDNFLHAGPQKFPFLNNETINYKDPIKRAGTRSFAEEEIGRQFFKFTYSKDLEPTSYKFLPTYSGIQPGSNNGGHIDMSENIESLKTDIVSTLVAMRKELESIGRFGKETLDGCKGFGISEEICTDPSGHYSLLSAEIKRRFGEGRVACLVSAISFQNLSDLQNLCKGAILTKKGATVFNSQQSIEPWIQEDHFVVMVDNDQNATKLTTYYKPAFPQSSSSDYCSGGNAKLNPSGVAGREKPPCLMEATDIKTQDLRLQINVPTTLLSFHCENQIFLTDFLACGDSNGFLSETDPEKAVGNTFARKRFTVERKRDFDLPLASRAGEIVGKPNQISYVSFLVSPKEPTVIHVLVGGLKESQGKYLLRARIDEFDLIKMEK